MTHEQRQALEDLVLCESAERAMERLSGKNELVDIKMIELAHYLAREAGLALGRAMKAFGVL